LGWRALIAWFCLSLPAAGAAAAQEKEPPPAPAAGRTPIEDFIAEQETRDAADARLPALELPDATALDRLDAELRQDVVAAMREYYRYRVSGFRHRRELFDWQLRSSKIIFGVVILLVMAGVYFSGVQFHAALRRRPAPAGEKEQAGEGIGGQLEASLSGIKVSSPVLGVIILVISFLFFYLYLVRIYPISDIF
jgi:hypothetical protein